MDWKRILDFTKTEVLGLDIGSSAVKVVCLRKDDTGYAVTAAGIAEIAASEEPTPASAKIWLTLCVLLTP